MNRSLFFMDDKLIGASAKGDQVLPLSMMDALNAHEDEDQGELTNPSLDGSMTVEKGHLVFRVPLESRRPEDIRFKLKVSERGAKRKVGQLTYKASIPEGTFITVDVPADEKRTRNPEAHQRRYMLETRGVKCLNLSFDVSKWDIIGTKEHKAPSAKAAAA